MMCDLDMIIEAHAPGLPFGMNVRLSRQRHQQRRIELFEQLATGATKLAQHALVVEPCDQRCDRGIQLGKAVKYLVAQPPEQPPLDDPDTRLDLGFVPRLSRPRRKARRAVMARHLGIAAIDLRIVKTRLDHRDLRIVGHQQSGRAAKGGKGLNVESYRRRTAIERKQQGAGRPAKVATAKNTGVSLPDNQPET